MKSSLCCFALFVCANTFAAAATTEELISQLKTELRAEVKKPPEGGESSRAYRLQELLARLLQSRTLGDENSDGSSLLNLVVQLEAVTGNEKLQEIAEELGAALRKDQEGREADLIFELEKTVSDALRQGLAAKTTKEIDDPLAAIAKFTRENAYGNSRSPKLQALRNQAQQAADFLKVWQDYLAASTASNTRGAQEKLQSLLNHGRDFSGFIPRSELLAKLEPLKPKEPELPDPANPQKAKQAGEKRFREILSRVKTLDDLPAAVAESSALQAEPRFGMNAGEGVSTLQMLYRTYLELKAGRATHINLGMPSNVAEETAGMLNEIRMQLTLYAIPRALGLPAEVKAAPGEDLAAFVQRIAADAQEKRNWLLLGRLIDVGRTLNVPTFTAPGDSSALTQFLAGLNQERARQWSMAVMSFQNCLKSGSQIVPSTEIGEHLERIRKEFPQEFERGVQLALAPPQSERVDPFGNPIPPSREPFYNPPKGRPPGNATPAPTLAVPAVPPPAPNAAAPTVSPGSTPAPAPAISVPPPAATPAK